MLLRRCCRIRLTESPAPTPWPGVADPRPQGSPTAARLASKPPSSSRGSSPESSSRAALEFLHRRLPPSRIPPGSAASPRRTSPAGRHCRLGFAPSSAVPALLPSRQFRQVLVAATRPLHRAAAPLLYLLGSSLLCFLTSSAARSASSRVDNGPRTPSFDPARPNGDRPSRALQPPQYTT
ncbi:hypothetical protein VPH35_104039 [Triticum aestivum]|uniref:uncharacterized protein n=1 Tax=Triticum aestivum TaxID=4565 RepID=UPI001D01D7E9|nr:uncharacterized protein LOC123130462 [Triticum aestivum]